MYQQLDYHLKNQFYSTGILKPLYGVRVLCYHGIVDQIQHPRLQRNFHTVATFKAHLQLLKRHGFRVITSDELLELKQPQTEKKTVMISFDDGYANNKKAMALLNDFKCPAVFFVSTGCIGTNISIWTVNLSLLILESPVTQIVFKGKMYPTSNFNARYQSFQSIRNQFKQMTASQRHIEFQALLGQVPEHFLEALLEQHPYFKMLNWSELQDLHESGINFQSHGHHHELHHQHQEETSIKEEIIISKRLLETKLNKNVRFFAYPNGNCEHSSSETLLKIAGYTAAFQLGNTRVTQNLPFAIKRLDPHSNGAKFLNALYL